MILSAGLLLNVATALAQQLVTGRVTDSHGQPVMGATVRVAGTKVSTTTDENGNFRLPNVPANAKRIQVSYIGMQPTTVDVAGNVQVALKDNEFNEAVVVGYGSAKKLGTVVGSVKKVSADAISDKPSANIADALQGQVAGLSILNSSGDIGDMGTTSLTIRGVGSLSASNTPLIVVDGSPAGTAVFNMLNDKDIESITTLKDASATSIYGSRAANGVIFITTKKGRRGEKAQVTVAQKVGWTQLAQPIGNPMNSNELLQFQLENGIISSDQYATYKLHGANTNWQRYYFDNNAPLYQTDFSVRGGSQNSSYFVSGSYLNQDNITKDSWFNRYTLTSNLETTPLEWMQFGLNQSVAYTDRRSDGYTYQSNNSSANYAISSYMTQPYYDPYDPESAADNRIWGSDSYTTQYYLDKQPRQTNDIVYNGSAFIQLTPLKGLTIRSQLGLYATDTRSSYAALASFPGSTTGQASESHSRSSLWTITNTAEYKFTVADNHHITLLAGQEGIKGSSKAFGASGTGNTDDRLYTLGNVTAGDIPSYSSAKYEYLSFFGRVDYNFAEKYFVNLTVRNDKSSRFGRDNRSATFISGGVMWNVTAEKFMAPTKSWLTDLQLKISVGTTGNSEIGNYASLGLTGTTQYMGQSGWVISQPSNNQLGWEKQIQTNFGFMARLFDRVNVDFNVYKRKTLDMLMSAPLPYTTGFSAQMLNIGKMSNRGVEVEVAYDAIRTRDTYLQVRATYSYNDTQIDELFYGLEEWPMLNYLLNYKVGSSLNYYMPIYAGVDKEDGAPMWYKPGYSGGEVHEYNEETMTKTFSDELYQDTGKKYYSPHTGGFGISAGWKGLSIAADFSFVLGKYMVNNDYYFAVSWGNALNGFNQDKDMLSYWKNPGDITNIPSPSYDMQFDTHLLENASFLRLKNLTVAYDLPKRWMEATGFIENVRFSFNARNVFTVTKYRGSDPEVNSNITLGSYPATRQFTLGAEITF